ncbi:hypothetical protein EYV94_25935 [Puteibacter caeruleilacunae]|nr:hypothetical protein EYV94_25935 [Puteibacter caeruleilacunae]
MKLRIVIVLTLLVVFGRNNVFGQYTLKSPTWQVQINEQGQIVEYKTKGNKNAIAFRNDKHAGPSFEGVELSVEDRNALIFSGQKGTLKYHLQYKNDDADLQIVASIKNEGRERYDVKYERLILGVDTYMNKYPEWNNKFFPTMLRAEKTHFGGYFMSPLGRVLAFASPDPIASWNYEYHNHRPYKNYKNAYVAGHRIYTVSLDLLHCLPLPDRHPQHMNELLPGEEHTVRLYLKELGGLDEYNDFISSITNAPAIELDLYTVAENEMICGKIVSESKPQVKVYGPKNVVKQIDPVQRENGVYDLKFKMDRGIGQYKIIASNEEGQVSEAIAFCREPWSWYLDRARNESLKCKPTSTHHAECFYPFYSYFLARKHLPNKEVDKQAEEIFQKLFFELFDPETKEMRDGKFRIQDAATMIGVLADRYQVTNDITDMENAAGLVEFLMRKQREDGGFYSGHNVHYTSVIYLAKSIMEYLTEAKVLASQFPEWKTRYNRHLEAVQKALDDLAKRGDNVETEGQMTFEDGMISCSASQLALGALRSDDEDVRNKYRDASLMLTDKHRCLTYLKMPDSRMVGATLRFWEAQYTINIMHGMMNSPCGWSAWKTYGIWYQYLLTGDEKFLKLAMNSLGTFMQLVNHESGKLRFSFTPDPYIETMQYLETPVGSGKAELQPVLLGESYIDMMSYWHRYPHPTWRQKWGIDNFVHEVFKCMEEVALTNAYIVEQPDGTFNTYNCELINEGGTLTVKANEELVDKLHVNLRNTYNIDFYAKTSASYKEVTGVKWVGLVPDDIKVYSKIK